MPYCLAASGGRLVTGSAEDGEADGYTRYQAPCRRLRLDFADTAEAVERQQW